MVPTDEELTELLQRSLDDAPAEPPGDRIAALRAGVEAARASQPGPTAIHDAPRFTTQHRRWRPVLAVAAGVVAVAAGFGAARLLDRSEPSTAGVVEYDGPMQGADQSDAPAQLLVVKTGIGRVVDLDTSALPILPVGDFYEVWFVGPDDSSEQPNRISAGTFHPDTDGRSDVRFAAAVDPAKYPTVEITAEPGDGNPAATGPVILRSDIG
ncbi:MAG: anti-sigma factor [Actinomycetota bacterium]|nr:anti-sigma factor [Actinomycetota bacterium]